MSEIEVYELHGHWYGDHTDCRCGPSLCAKQDRKLADRRRYEDAAFLAMCGLDPRLALNEDPA